MAETDFWKKTQHLKKLKSAYITDSLFDKKILNFLCALYLRILTFNIMVVLQDFVEFL